jgi:hypothetical protein
MGKTLCINENQLRELAIEALKDNINFQAMLPL